MNRLLAELLGTFALVFIGCGAIVADAATGGGVTHVGIALAFGLVVMAVIDTVGDVSGAHINPAVTLGFAAAGRLPWKRVPPYIAAQCLGALAASGLLLVAFPGVESTGQSRPAGAAAQAFIIEAVLTCILMLVILAVAAGPKEKGLKAGVAVGGTVAFMALAFGPITGASMNPARTLGPAVAAGDLEHLAIYLTATPLGAIAAVPLHGLLSRGPSA